MRDECKIAIAKKADISKTQISRIINSDGSRPRTKTISKIAKNEEISLNTLKKIAEILNCNIGDLVEFKKIEKGVE